MLKNVDQNNSEHGNFHAVSIQETNSVSRETDHKTQFLLWILRKKGEKIQNFEIIIRTMSVVFYPAFHQFY